MKNKFLKPILFLIILLIFSTQTAFAKTTIYENKTSEIVSKGVIRENIKKFTSSGWVDINILRVDLTDPYINIDTIFSREGISSRSTVLEMAYDSNAISAINGDFFSPRPGTTLAHPVGPVIQNNKLISTPTIDDEKHNFGVFALNKSNTPYYLYWSKNITLVAPNSKSMPILDVNKFGWYESLYMYDNNWGKTTIGKSDTFPTLTQMVVVNNKVKSISSGKGPIDIPQNGYVICGDYEAGNFLKSNFKIGSKVTIQTRTSPNWNLFKTAIGGGAFLVKHGKIPNYTHVIDGIHPRTAIGTTKDNKEAILVTVDGRQLSSIGMTMTEFSHLMISLGTHNAINLDGGGSTTMVSRDLGETGLKIINNCSDGPARIVTNGIGVFTTAPKSDLYGIKINSIDNNVFKNSSRELNIIGYDKYFNTINISSKKIDWSVAGVNGTFKDNTFYPSSSGQAEITANVDGIKETIKINVLDYPTELILSPSNFAISTVPDTLNIYGKDKFGYSAKISLSDIDFLPKSLINIAGNNISLKNNSIKYLKVSFGDVYTYIANSNYSSLGETKVLDGFENNNNSFWGYPSTVDGNFSLSSKVKKFGKSSGNLEFDFTKTDDTKGAYIKLNSTGYKINSAPTKLSVWSYSENHFPHSIKAEFIDADENVFRTTFSSQIDWTDWKELTTSIPLNTKYPITLRKIYIVQTDGAIKDSGNIYFDDLKIFYNAKSFSIPNSKALSDFEKKSSIKPNNNSYQIGIFSDISDISILEKYRLKNKINSLDFTGFLVSNNEIKSSNYIINDSYNVKKDNNSLFITLKTNNNESIRKTNYKQWTSLLDNLKENDKNYVFIMLDNSLEQFSDSLEAELFKNILSDYVEKTNKKVWVIYNDDETRSMNENGVKYIGISSSKPSKYLKVSIDSDKIEYAFENI